jgi:hypothetical protein
MKGWESQRYCHEVKGKMECSNMFVGIPWKCWHKFAVVNIFVIWKKRHLTEKIILNLTLLYIEINIEITCQEDNLIKSKSFI